MLTSSCRAKFFLRSLCFGKCQSLSCSSALIMSNLKVVYCDIHGSGIPLDNRLNGTNAYNPGVSEVRYWLMRFRVSSWWMKPKCCCRNSCQILWGCIFGFWMNFINEWTHRNTIHQGKWTNKCANIWCGKTEHGFMAVHGDLLTWLDKPPDWTLFIRTAPPALLRNCISLTRDELISCVFG